MTFYNDNGQIQTQSISGIWSLDYDHLNLIDDETGVSYELGWDLSEEGDSYCFELTEDDTTYYLYESAAEDVDSTLDILTSYLTAEDSVDVESDDIDLSDFLEDMKAILLLTHLCSAVFLLILKPENTVQNCWDL